jgi:hypothetical protein
VKNEIKKVAIIAVSLVGFSLPAQAEIVTFEYDFMPVYSAGSGISAVGQSFTLAFKVDDNLRAGMMHESMELTTKADGTTQKGNVQIDALNLEFTALKATIKDKAPVIIGLNLGSANLNTAIAGTAPIAATTEMLTDLYVKSEYSSGKHSYVGLKLGYRMLSLAEDNGEFDHVNGLMLKVGVGARF